MFRSLLALVKGTLLRRENPAYGRGNGSSGDRILRPNITLFINFSNMEGGGYVESQGRERPAGIELTKGKSTADPVGHTGQGVFFTCRTFDAFSILSGEVFLSHTYGDDEDWILQNQEPYAGTWIVMKLNNNTSRTENQIFDGFTSDDDFGFTDTVVPVGMAQYGDEKLVSRSQAKKAFS